MTRWPVDQVVGLAPDDASASAGRRLAGSGGWSGEGCDDRSVWGLAQGSGKNPYQVAVDLQGPAFKCSCPSRKIPCKHVLGLLLRWAQSDVDEGQAPEFATEWLSSRDERLASASERKAVRAEKEADPAARAKRAAKREERIDAGLDELERWLHDLLRAGLAAARGQSMAFWDRTAARLVDAQAPGLAGRVRAMASHVHAGDEWPSRLLAEAARLQLCVEAWRRRDTLADDLGATVRAVLGWPVPAEEVRSREAVEDAWVVLGQVAGTEDRLLFRRTWLRGRSSDRAALILQFAPRGGAFDGEYVVGSVVEGALCFYPAALPLRALPRDELRRSGDETEPARSPTIASLLDGWATALARDPWLDRWPFALESTPVRHAGSWWLRDESGDSLPLTVDEPWRLVAAAGARPVLVAGELSSSGVRPLTVFSESGPVRV